MPKPLDAVLARWSLLYPEITSAREQDDDVLVEAETIRKEVIAPLLHTDDIHIVIDEKKGEYRRWRDSLPAEDSDPKTALAREERFDDTLAATFGSDQGILGEQAVKAILESIKLQRIVRRSVLPHRETWPEESWDRIGDLMSKSEICIAGILECLTTGEGSRANVGTLARMAFENALAAYYDAGENGQDSTRLEDIPE